MTQLVSLAASVVFLARCELLRRRMLRDLMDLEIRLLRIVSA